MLKHANIGRALFSCSLTYPSNGDLNLSLISSWTLKTQALLLQWHFQGSNFNPIQRYILIWFRKWQPKTHKLHPYHKTPMIHDKAQVTTWTSWWLACAIWDREGWLRLATRFGREESWWCGLEMGKQHAQLKSTVGREIDLAHLVRSMVIDDEVWTTWEEACRKGDSHTWNLGTWQNRNILAWLMEMRWRWKVTNWTCGSNGRRLWRRSKKSQGR